MLKREFIEDSIKAGRWLEEKLYEWSEQDEVDGVSASHIAAPGRWRRILQEERGPFDGWKALVAVADAKRRAAYKRQATVQCALYFNTYTVREAVHVYWFPPFYKILRFLTIKGLIAFSYHEKQFLALRRRLPPVAGRS